MKNTDLIQIELGEILETSTENSEKRILDELNQIFTSENTSKPNVYWYILDLLAIGIIGSAGQLYIKPSIAFAGDNRALQIILATCGVIGGSAPNINATLYFIRNFQSQRKRNNYFFKTTWKTKLLKLTSISAISLTALLSIIPFLEISLENENHIFWIIDIALARFVFQFFGLYSIFQNRLRIDENFNIPNINIKLIRKNLIEYIMVAKQEILKNRTLLDLSSQNNSILLLNSILILGFNKRNRQNKYLHQIKNIARKIGVIVSTVGLTGYGAKLFQATEHVTDNFEIQHEINFAICIIFTVLAMSGWIYLVGKRGADVFGTLTQIFFSLFSENGLSQLTQSASLQMFPLITSAFSFIALLIASLSWASHVFVTVSTFGETMLAKTLCGFAIISSVVFNGYSMISGIISPLIHTLANHSNNKNVIEINQLDIRFDQLLQFISDISSENLYLLFNTLHNNIKQIISEHPPTLKTPQVVTEKTPLFWSQPKHDDKPKSCIHKLRNRCAIL